VGEIFCWVRRADAGQRARPVETLGQRGRVHVAPAGVVVAMGAAAAGAVVAELRRIFWIGEIPDEKAFLVARIGIRRRRPLLGDFLERRDHSRICDLDLDGPGPFWDWRLASLAGLRHRRLLSMIIHDPVRLWLPTSPRVERIQHGDAGRLEIRYVAGHDSEAVLERGRGDGKVEPLVADPMR
jgi:hypothetical protein